MKKAVLLKLFLLVTCWAYAQTTYSVRYVDNGGWPGGVRTGFVLSKFGWAEITPGSAAVNAWSQTQALPFNFLFFGQPVTHFKVSENMLLTFDTTDTRLPNDNRNLPTSVLPDQTIAAYWDRFTISPPTANDAKVVTKEFGTAPLRQFWIVWYNYEYGSPGAITSYNAVVLEETTNKIYVVDQFSNNGNGITGTVGLQLSGTTAVQAGDSLSFLNMNAPQQNESDYIEFRPRVITPFDVSADALNSPLAGKAGCYTATEPVEVAVINYGTSPVSQVPVSVQVSGAVTRTFNGTYTGTIQPNDTVLVNLGTLDMTLGGTYNFMATASLPNDGDATNNSLTDTVRISVTPAIAMPTTPITFTGYNGWNLAQVAPGWATYSNPGMPGGNY
ncbi:MAG: hypothetical protein LPK19_15695, partial [Hymenobacteraceae bacterium]|nr:hypothetical protein [Hymenobacteraceae bacterium]MDX5513758.1 hypothetical protein [Hymenobacteraceae bacterium]